MLRSRRRSTSLMWPNLLSAVGGDVSGDCYFLTLAGLRAEYQGRRSQWPSLVPCGGGPACLDRAFSTSELSHRGVDSRLPAVIPGLEQPLVPGHFERIRKRYRDGNPGEFHRAPTSRAPMSSNGWYRTLNIRHARTLKRAGHIRASSATPRPHRPDGMANWAYLSRHARLSFTEGVSMRDDGPFGHFILSISLSPGT